MSKAPQKQAIQRAMLRQELARRDYLSYLELVHGERWISTRFSAFLAHTVQEFLEADTGNAYDILLLTTPPQHGKSMTLTESLPSWIMGHSPEWRVILASYNEESAERFSRRNREKLQVWGSVLFGVSLGDLARATEFELAPPHKGRLISRGIMSGMTGHAAELVIIDDPIKNREEADSAATRDKIFAEWMNSIKSRLAAKAKVILIMTRWHEDDLAGRILQTEKNVRLLRLPVEAESTPEEPDPLGRASGETLCPELGKDKHWLEQFRESYLRSPKGGARAWTALYMCRPRVEDGNLIKREWWKFYHDVPPLNEYSIQIISVDATFKDTGDYVALTVWQKTGAFYYLLDCINAHMDFIATLEAIRTLHKNFPQARGVLIEDKANGPAIINILQKEFSCIPVNPKGGKVARVNAISTLIESGHVLLPETAPWVEDYVDQWTAFPAAAHDDMVDSSSQALSYLVIIPAVTDTSDEEDDDGGSDGSYIARTKMYQPYDILQNRNHTDLMTLLYPPAGNRSEKPFSPFSPYFAKEEDKNG